MPIELRTGLPGAGKTLGAVESLIERRKREPGRVLYQHGITELRDGLAIPLTVEQVKDWRSLPAGAVLYVDEVQKLMPAMRGDNVPDWISALSEHRHLGLDFVFITQHPSLIHPYVRKLVDRHVHTIRSYGTKFVERYSWPLCVSDPNGKSVKKSAEAKNRHAFSREAMSAYKSAELHTIKPSIPRYLKVCLALLVAVPSLGYVAYRVMHRPAVAQGDNRTGPATLSDVADSKHPALSRDEWVHRQIPRVAGIPWSAPIYDDNKVQTTPQLYCASYDADHGRKDCECLTEQGTQATVPYAMCMQFAKGGVYNPYRAALDGGQSHAPNAEAEGRSQHSQNVGEPIGSMQGTASESPRPGISDSYTPPGTRPWNPDPFGSSKK